MTPITRAGIGSEIYLIPTVPVAPTTASAEYGLEPGFPTPAATNRTNQRLGIVGSVREDSKALLPLTITVEGTASIRAGLQSQVERAQATGSQIKITDLIRQVKRAIHAPAGGVPVPRFSVQRSGQPLMGIDPDFTGASFSTLTAPAGYVMPPNVDYAPNAPMVIDDRGRLLCGYLVEKSGGGDSGKHRIVLYYYDQALHTDWQAAVTVDDWDTEWVLNNGAVLNTPHLALVNYRGDIYAIVSDAGTIVSAATGSILVYRVVTNGSATPPWNFESVGTPVRIATTKGVLANGGIAAAALPDRVVVAVGAVGLEDYGFREETRGIWVGQSTDMEQWSDSDDNGGGFTAISSFQPLLPVESDGSRLDQKINKVVMYVAGDASRGWAVTDGGRIYTTEDSGQTWVRQTSPVSVALYDIAPVSGTGDAIVVYACGASGCMLKTTDSGKTWKVLSISAGEAGNIDRDQFIDPNVKSSPQIGDGPLHGMAWWSSSRGWVVGTNKIAFTNAGGVPDKVFGSVVKPWKAIEPRETTATYTCVAIIDSDTILVGGAIQRQRSKNTGIGRDLKRYRFVKIKNADSPKYNSGDYVFHDETSSDAYRIESIFIRSATQAYACGRGGTLLQTSTLGSDPPTWGEFPSGVPKRDLMHILWREGKSSGTPTESKNEFLVATADGLLCRSVNNGANWIVQHVGDEAVGGSIAVTTTDTEGDEDNVILYGGGQGLWRTDLGMVFEAFPSLLPLSSGEVLLATANLQAGRIDLRRSRDRGMSFSPVDLSTSAVVTFTPQTAFETLDNTSLAPSLSVADDGTILLTAGSGGVVNIDGRGTEWVERTSRSLALALGEFAITNAASQNRSRQTIPFGGGRLFSTSVNVNGDIETRTGREWSTTSLIFCPVNPAVPQWIGVDDVRVVWSSLSLPQGERWTVSPEYRFPARHLIVESRQMYWRNDALGVLSAPITMQWDRQDSAVLSALGDGAAWNLTAAALFGTCFRRATLALTVPGYSSASWPSSASDYTEFALDATVDEGMLTRAPDGTGSPYNVLAVAGKTWVPGQWKKGNRTFYAEVEGGGGVVLAYEIVDNGPDTLIVKRNENLFSLAEGQVVRIFGDRMWCSGAGGYRGGLPVDPLIDTPYEMGRLIRLTIPVQPTPLGYAKIEGICLGRHVAATIKTGEGTAWRDRFDREHRTRITQAAIQETSLTGATASEAFGRPLKSWNLTYTAAQWFDLAATLGPIVPAMTKAFTLVFDDADPQSAEWVMLNGEIEVQHQGGDLHSVTLPLKEVG